MKTKSQAPEVTAAASNSLKSYQTVDENTGEVMSKYRYLEGHPKSYRFDAKDGQFNINGTDKLGDTLTFQPVAWRIFSDNILNLGTKNWAEIFFVDDKNCLSAILFHGYSVDNIYRLIEPLFYEDLTLADVVITVRAEKKENTKITPRGVYYIASFSYQVADKEKVQELQEFVADRRVYRQETLTDLAQVRVAQGYFSPFGNAVAQTLLLAEQTA